MPTGPGSPGFRHSPIHRARPSDMKDPLVQALKGKDKLLYRLIHAIGWGLSKAPTWLVSGTCRLLGALTFRFSSRRHTILDGITRAFPERDQSWHEQIARIHCDRMFEMFLLILALPHWSESAVRRRFGLGDSLARLIIEHGQTRPIFFAIPHSALMESLTVIPLLMPQCPPIMTLYRPLDSTAAEAYVHWARERWGARLLARREGLLKAKKQLTSGHGIVGVLFDQSAGDLGHLTLFFNRVCSTTNLPGLLVAKSSALPIFLHTRREGFWRGTIEGSLIPESPSAAETVVRVNEALENHLRNDDSACASWFWAHKRWKGPQRARLALAFPRRKSYLKEQVRLLGLGELPRKTRIAIRLDPRPELLRTARRLVRVIRSQRPDAVFWLLVPEGLATEKFGPIDRTFTLPGDPRARRVELSRVNRQHLDMLFSLDPSRSATKESPLLECEYSAGVVLPGATRRAYRHATEVEPEDYLRNPWKAWRKLLPQAGLPLEILDDLVAVRPASKPSPSVEQQS